MFVKVVYKIFDISKRRIKICRAVGILSVSIEFLARDSDVIIEKYLNN